MRSIEHLFRVDSLISLRLQLEEQEKYVERVNRLQPALSLTPAILYIAGPYYDYRIIVTTCLGCAVRCPRKDRTVPYASHLCFSLLDCSCL